MISLAQKISSETTDRKPIAAPWRWTPHIKAWGGAMKTRARKFTFVVAVIFSVILISIGPTAVLAEEEGGLVVETEQDAPVISEPPADSGDNQSDVEPGEPNQKEPDADVPLDSEMASMDSWQPAENEKVEVNLPVPSSDVDVFSGAARYTIPIEVPPGRNGMAPRISLEYNSFLKNGWVGVGWQLDMGAIQRSTKRGVDYAANDYVFVKNGRKSELVSREAQWGANFYGAKIEEDFSRYYFDISVTGGWVVTARDGTRYYYGSSSDSRQENSLGVFKWCLDEVRDTNGNYLKLTYTKANGQIYLQEIVYTGNHQAQVQGTNSVKFILEARSDDIFAYVSRSKVKTAKRLKRIEVYANDGLVRKYQLTYQKGASSRRSCLKEIQITGDDGSSTFPPIKVTGLQDGGNGEFTNQYRRIGSDTGYYNAYFADINGDGFADFITYHYVYTEGDSGGEVTTSTVYTYLAKGDGTFKNVGSSTGLDVRGPDSGDLFFPDINGDGLADMVFVDPGYSPSKNYIYLSNGDGTFDYYDEIHVGGSIHGSVTSFADVNGDGLADLISHWGTEYSTTVYSYLSNGDGTFESAVSTSLRDDASSGFLRFPDINGDGLADLVILKGHRYGSGNKNNFVYMGKGDGTFVDNDTKINTWTDDFFAEYFADVNGDGLDDFVMQDFRWEECGDGGWFEINASDVRVHLSKGDGTFRDGVRTNLEDMSSRDVYGPVRFPDINGDGLADMVVLKDSTFNQGSGRNIIYLSDGDDAADLVTAIQNGLGGTVIFEYTPSTEYQNSFLPFIVQTVSNVTVEDGLGNQSTRSYSYAGGLYDPPTREFRGFETVSRIEPDLAVRKTEFNQSEFKKGRAEWSGLWAPAADPDVDTPLVMTTYTWGEYSIDSSPENGCVFVKLERKRTEYNDAVTVFSQEDYTYDDTYGNPATMAGNLIEAETSGTDGENVTTKHEYQNYGDWLWREKKTTLENELGEFVRKTRHVYENGTGNLMSTEFVLDTGPNPTVHFTYDTYGNKKTFTDANNNLTTWDYDDTTHTYPVKVTNALGHIVEYQYDERYGKVTAKKDENQNWTYYHYDHFGRIETVDYPDGGQETTEYYDDIFPRLVITKVKEDAAGNTVDTYRYYDGLDREIQTITFGEGGKSIVTEKFYDEMGRNDYTEGPFFATGVGYPKQRPAEYPWKRTVFDPRGRPLQITSPDSEHQVLTTSFSYSGFKTTVTDPDGNRKTEKRDYLGRIIRVTEHAAGNNYYTYYTYNAAGDLLTIKNHRGNVTTINYDTLGRKINMNDPDLKYWEFTYDANGNLLTQTDAKSQVITFAYDALNRKTSKTYSTSDPPVTYTYDKSWIENGVGRLSIVTKGDTKIIYNKYDEMGRVKVKNNKRKISGQWTSYKTRFDYDLSGKLTKVTYPDDYEVSYAYYPGTGLLQSATGSDSEQYAVFTAYEPTGKIGRVDHGNGAFTVYTYDPLSTRLLSIVTRDDQGVDLQNRSYSYTPAGDIEEITDGVKGVTYTYTYDKLHRLLSETNTGSYDPVSYTYNAIGNITSKTVGTEVLDYKKYVWGHKHAVKEIEHDGTTYTYTYDANGNMKTGYDFRDLNDVATFTITYDADNMPTQIVYTKGGSSTTTSFTYDGDGVRAIKTVQGGSTTYYAGKYYEITDGVATKYIFAADMRIAKLEGTELHYFHKDHLGSSTVMTDESSSRVEGTEYMPFGQIRDHTGTDVSKYRFTDQELDSETGLYNYDARLYDPVIGRFVSPDSIVPDLYDPQSLNRYSYCRNNPLRYVDPSGHFDNDMEHGGRAVGEHGRGGAGVGNGLGGDAETTSESSSSDSGSLFESLIDLATPNEILFVDKPTSDKLKKISRWGKRGLLFGIGLDLGFKATTKKEDAAQKSEKPTWPKTAEEMEDYLGVKGKKVPDKPYTPGRDKTIWQPSDKVKIIHEKHPYHTEKHKTGHWHLDTPEKRHQTFEPGDPIPGY